MPKYDWGDGKGKVHSRPKRTGAQLEKAKDKKRLADPAYFTQPATLGDVLREAGRAEELRYGGVQGQLDLQGQQIPAWFDQYRQTLQTPQQVEQTYQPVIAQQQQAQQQTGQTLGLTGPAAEQDALAAKAREALAGLGTAVLQNAQQADTTYFQGRQGVAQAAQIGAQTQNRQALTDLSRERGAFRDTYVSDARDRERAYGLQQQHQANENKAFGLDVYKAEQDARDAAARRRQDRREDRARQRDKDEDQGLQRDKFRSDREKDAYQKAHGLGPYKKSSPGGKSLTPSEKRQRRKDKEERQRRNSFIEATIRNPPTYPKGHPKAGQSPSRAEVIDQLVKKGYSKEEIKKVLRRMYGTVQRPGNAPSGNGQQRPT